MNNKETITNFARETMENLFSMNTASLSKMLLAKLPANAFEESASNYDANKSSFEKCSLFTPVGKSAAGMSGLKPKVYVSADLPVTEARAVAARALWTIASEIFVNEHLDVADLSAWSDNGFQFELKIVGGSFIDSYSNSVQMIGLGSEGEIKALASLSPIRKLVLPHD